MFVGNSQIFIGNVPKQLQLIARMYDVEIIYKDISRHGNRGGTLNELSAKAISEMQNYKYDYVVFQDETGRSFNNIDGLLKNNMYKGSDVFDLAQAAWVFVNSSP